MLARTRGFGSRYRASCPKVDPVGPPFPAVLHAEFQACGWGRIHGDPQTFDESVREGSVVEAQDGYMVASWPWSMKGETVQHVGVLLPGMLGSANFLYPRLRRLFLG